MESVIHDQLISYLRTHNLISNNQHGFLARRSTGTNLLNCFQDWQIAIKNKQLIDIIYLDFQKAFDSLIHNKIIASEVNPTSCSIFANDLKIYCSYDSIHDNSSFVHTIRNIERWSSLWQLRINPEKSILLQVGSAPTGQSQYVICNQIISLQYMCVTLVSCTTQNCVSRNILPKLLPELFNVSICCFVLLFLGMF